MIEIYHFLFLYFPLDQKMKHFSIYVLAVCFLHNGNKNLRLAFLFPGVCQSALTDYIIRAKIPKCVKQNLFTFITELTRKQIAFGGLKLDKGRNQEVKRERRG